MSRYAKEHSLDIPHYSAIEFPLIVNDTDKAIQLVGGEEAIVKATQDHDQHPLELRFTGNRYEHPIASTLSHNENIVLKISVPTKEYEENNKNIRKTLAQLNKAGNTKPVTIQPLGVINKTFRFRELSDFQYHTENNEFAQKVDESIHDLNYRKIKETLKFEQDPEPSKPDANGLFNFPAPPRFSSIPLPFDYKYTKNVHSVEREGKYEVKNRPFRLHASILKYDDPVPMEPPAAVVEKLDYYLQNFTRNTTYKDTLKVIDIIKGLFAKKPIWIRKHIEAIVPVPLRHVIKYALPHIAYTYVDGPWRQNYIKFGVDPKSSSEYAKYQLGAFRVNGYRNQKSLKTFATDNPQDVATAFKFKGDDIPLTLLFQIEQLIDPDILNFLKDAKFKEEPDFADGWFDKVTMDKIRLIVPFKLKALLKGEQYNQTRLQVLLDRIDDQNTEGHDSEHEDDTDVDVDVDVDQAGEEEDEDEDEDSEDDDFFDATLNEEENFSKKIDEEMEINAQEASFEGILQYLEKHNPDGAEDLRRLTGIVKLRDLDI